MNFKDQYRKAYDKAAPSKELQQETLELMQEARAHRIQKETLPAPRRFRYIPAVATAAAALFVGCVLLGFWLNQGDTVMEDAVGDMDGIFTDQFESESFDSDDTSSDSTPPDTEDQNSGNAGDWENTEVPDDETTKTDFSGNGDADVNNSSSDADSNNSAENDTAGAGSDVESKNDASISEDYIIENNKGLTEEDPASTAEAVYPSLLAFTEALSQKSAAGYGKNYYNTRDLLIVPALLPDHAVFQGLHLNGTDGTYSYSYFFTANEITYLLEVEIKTAAPKSLSALNEALSAVKEETVSMTKADHTRTYLFGEDCAEVRVTSLLSNILPDEATVDQLLRQFQLERCSKTNPLLGLSS